MFNLGKPRKVDSDGELPNKSFGTIYLAYIGPVMLNLCSTYV